MILSPITSDIGFDSSWKPQLPRFHVWWNPVEIDICGRNSFGSSLGIADNDENVFETYEECVRYYEWQNNQRTETKQLGVKCDWDSTFNYLKVLYKRIKTMLSVNDFWKLEKRNGRIFFCFGVSDIALLKPFVWMTDRSWKTITPEIAVYFKTLARNTYLPPIRIPCECCTHTDEDLGRYLYLKLSPPYIPLRMLVRSKLYRNYSPSTPAYFIDGVCPLLFSDYQECCDECDRLNAIDMDITKAKSWIKLMHHVAIIIHRRI